MLHRGITSDDPFATVGDDDGRHALTNSRSSNATMKPPPPPPSSSLKPPPPTPPLIASPPYSSIQEEFGSSSFADTFDEDFIRQQEEILSTIQSNLLRPQDFDPHSRPPSSRVSSQADKTKCILPKTSTPRNLIVDPNSHDRHVYLDRTASSCSNDGGSTSQHTGTTVTNSTRHSSLCTSFTSSGGAQPEVARHYQQGVFGASKTEQETDILTFLEDAEMIREQQRILEQIQQQRDQQDLSRNAEARTSPFVTPSSGRSSHAPMDHHTLNPIYQQTAKFTATSLRTSTETRPARSMQSQHQQDDPQPLQQECQRRSTVPAASSRRRRDTAASDLREKRRAAPRNFKSSSPSVGRSQQFHHMEDRHFQVGNKSLRVQGTRKAYDAIANGKAIIVQCATCKAILQIAASAKLLYCSLCENVTPVHLAREQQVMDPNGNSTVSLFDLDARISRTIQNQEEDVACARKLAKASR
jgi:hypothetical protein